MTPLLEVRNLSVAVGGQTLVDGVGFTLAEGEGLAIIGPNGAGKTILLRALLGLMPYSGSVRWAPGVRIGYVPQKIDFDRYLPMSVEDFFAAKLKIARIPRAALDEPLSVVGFAKEMLRKNMGHLSFGQFQKALIVFALLGDPQVLILDEATLGVDVPYETYVYDRIAELRAKRRLAIVLVSHELEIVYRYTTKVLCLNRRVICMGAPQEALNERVLKELYKEATLYVHHHDHDAPHDL